MARKGATAVAEPETTPEEQKPDEQDELAGYYQDDDADDEDTDELDDDSEDEDDDSGDEEDDQEPDDSEDEDEDEEPEASAQQQPNGEKSIAELLADYEADRPMRRADIERLSQYQAEQARIQQEEQDRLATIQNAVPNAATAIVEQAAQRFVMDDNQKDALKLVVDNVLLNGENALRETVGAAILTPVVNLMAGALLAAGATPQEVQQTEVKDFISLAAKVAERKLVASGEYVKKSELGKAEARGRKDGRTEFEAANPERAGPRPGRGDRSARPKTYEQLETGYGAGTLTTAEEREYLRQRSERE